MTPKEAANLITFSASKLADLSPFDLIGVLETYGLFSEFKAIANPQNLKDYMSTLDTAYASNPDVLLGSATTLSMEAVNRVNDINFQNNENAFYIKTYADLIKKAIDYRAEIENLNSQLPVTKSALEAAHDSSPMSLGTIDKYSAAYADIQDRIAFLTARVKEIEAQIPPRTQKMHPTDDDKNTWNMSQLSKQLEAIARAISQLIDSSALPYPILLKKYEFNSIYDTLTEPFKSNFKRYAY